MNKTHSLLLIVLIIGFVSNTLSAKHLIGGEMSYKCLGEGDYEIILRVYRDCLTDGANFDQAANFAVFQCDGTINCTELDQGSQGFKFTVALDTILPVSYPDATCELPQLCVEQGIYRFRLSDYDAFLPTTNNSYHIVHQRCCRNESITNIQTPEDYGNTFAIAITPAAQQVCNNSPIFDNFPPVITCINELFEYQQLATDEEGDSLVYSFSTPLHGGGNDVTRDNYKSCTGAIPDPPCPPPYALVPFVSPLYNAQYPFGRSDQTIGMKSATGLINGVPTLSGQFVAGLSVSEYRNGVLLSVTQREFQINIINCLETNDRIGTACDDGNPNTEKDRIQEDCNCRGVITAAAKEEKEVFISEYIESTSTDKCIELYNPLDQPVLPEESYVIKIYNEDHPNGLIIHTIIDTILPYGTYLICNIESDPTLTTRADGLFAFDFDGNDAITLEKEEVLIDLFGNRTCYPEEFWRGSTPGIRTQNKTLVRCPCIQNGVKADPIGCEFPVLSEEWICFPVNATMNIGRHDTIASPNSFFASLTDIYCACAETCRKQDSLILVDLYTSTKGENWINKWDLAQPLDTWFGLTLNEEGCVTCLDLDGITDCNNANDSDTVGNNLVGTLPDNLGELENLEALYLSNNQLSSVIPRSMGKLFQLQKIWLDRNDFTGDFPVGFILLDDLQEVVLDHNQLTGVLPPEMAILQQLSIFTASNNQLEGCFPDTYLDLCAQSINFSNNPALAWEGNFTMFCENDNGQIGASCDDGNEETTSDIIQADCICKGQKEIICTQFNILGELKDPIPISTCEDMVTLIADSFPSTFTGTWFSPNDSLRISNPTSIEITLNQLPIGPSFFAWMADTINCTSYIPEMYEVTRLGSPVLQKDSFLIIEKEEPFAFTISSSDAYPTNYTILNAPNHGILQDMNNGNFEFQATTTFEFQDQFHYEVCYENCPTLCDQSIVVFQLQTSTIEQPTLDENFVPNTITPNGDGLNDQFIFSQLQDPFAFPNNELLVFNRWGDQVFFARPYDNTWNGITNEGTQLMDGTYYYILRLEVGQGNVLRGMVTILR